MAIQKSVTQANRCILKTKSSNLPDVQKQTSAVLSAVLMLRRPIRTRLEVSNGPITHIERREILKKVKESATTTGSCM